MDKKEKRPGYFARLKKRRQLKQSQSERSVNEQDQSEAGQKPPVICEPQEKGLKEECEKTKEQHQSTLSTDDSSNPISQLKKKQRPAGTVEYTVCANDTLTSVALKFNITPNKLVQLNRLYSRCLVPGQKLFVPDVGQLDSSQQNGSADLDSGPPPSKPTQDGEVSGSTALLLQRQLSPPSEDESPATVKFIKMSCKYFTDGMGVVGGVMIVTPNNIMFDPHKSDPLVIEHGCEEYGLICPMMHLLSVALYDDVSRMNIKDALPSDLPPHLCPLYRPSEWEQLPSDRELNPFSRYEALERQRHHHDDPRQPGDHDDHCPHHDHDDQRQHHDHDDHCQHHDDHCQHHDEQGGTPPPSLLDNSPSDEGFTELEPLGGDGEEEEEGEGDEEDEGLHTRSSEEISDASRPPSAALLPPHDPSHPPATHTTPQTQAGEVSTETQEVQDAPESRGGRRGAPQSRHTHIHTHTHTQPNTPPTVLAGHQEGEPRGGLGQGQGQGQGNCGKCSLPQEEEAGLTEEERRRRSNKAEVKLWLLQRMQGPIENMLLPTEEKSKAPPMFLCFKVGQPMRKSFAVGQPISPAHCLGGRGQLWEYWFAVPQERVDDLYSFFVQWSPETYGKEAREQKEVRGQRKVAQEEQGFIVVDKEELNMIDNFFSEVPRNWEIITINEAKRRQSLGGFEEAEPIDLLPSLSDPSTLLDHTHIQKLCGRLPARVQGYPWRLAYSTVEHGTSLKTLYRNMAALDCPVLMAIRDMDNQVFGAFSTHPFRVSEHCYGTGETFLFNFCPEIKVYRWTGENSYFVKGSLDSLQLGGGGGRLGLWLDADLYHGTSDRCSTFHNPPLATHTDFTVHSLEVWAFE
ncbi:hypothetical protein ACEWY4_022012 [Coilia grayii]|uniref:Nuclear receptor coactivator 7-like n=1 Tax=Coilia grayii TaxID=363190 RepID=A0ABD1J5V2_9TELE